MFIYKIGGDMSKSKNIQYANLPIISRGKIYKEENFKALGIFLSPGF